MIKPILTASFILSAYSAQAKLTTSFHGEGLPLRVEEKQEAIDYREEFMTQTGITTTVDKYGLTQIEGNENVGYPMIKATNVDEGAFKTIIGQNAYKNKAVWGNGLGFITSLEILTNKEIQRKNEKIMRGEPITDQDGCISKISSVSHGWRSEGRRGERNALSGPNATGSNGVYASYNDIRSLGLIKKNIALATGASTLDGNLRRGVRNGTIRFCNICVAQFFACNIGTNFAKVFAQETGCQTVAATGQNSPVFQNKENTYEGKQKVYRGAHYWGSFAAISEENKRSSREKGYDRLGSWYRATPIKDQSGRIYDIVEENLGEEYISL